MSNVAHSHLDERTYDLLFDVCRSTRYHSRRERFYEIWSSITIFVMIFGSSSAVAASLIGLQESLGWLHTAISIIIAVFGAAEVAVGITARRANIHADLARRFITLEKRFVHGRNLEDAEFEELACERLEIELLEPPPLVLLDMICRFELLRAFGESKKQSHIPGWRRFLANVLSQHDFVQAILARQALKQGNAQAT